MEGLTGWLALIPVEFTGEPELDDFVNEQVLTALGVLAGANTPQLEDRLSA